MVSHFARAATLAAPLAAAAGLFAADAMAQPAALVDSVSITLPGVAPMDYLAAGTSIDLGKGGLLVIDYLASCIREEIVGGVVKIGTAQSVVEQGTVRRQRVECDGPELQLTAAQSDQGGVAVYRSALNKGPDGLPMADITLRSRAPIIATRQSGTIRIERLDTAETPLDVVASAEGRGAVDLGAAKNLLSAGGLYRATAGQRSVVFRIEANAGGADMPRLSRLLPL